jgi:hypothetical protein
MCLQQSTPSGSLHAPDTGMQSPAFPSIDVTDEDRIRQGSTGARLGGSTAVLDKVDGLFISFLKLLKYVTEVEALPV